MKALKEREGSNLVHHRDGSQSLCHPPVCTACVQACQLLMIFLQMLWCSQSVLEITEGEAREEVCSSVNSSFLLLRSMGRTNKVSKVLCY